MSPPGLLPLLRCMMQEDWAFLAMTSGSTVGIDAFKLMVEAVRNHADQCHLFQNYSGALGYWVQKLDSIRMADIRPLPVLAGRRLDGKAVAGRTRGDKRRKATGRPALHCGL
eukprot:SAG22_NODE_5918_length_931_cov_1.319712_1_plen_111_part_10